MEVAFYFNDNLSYGNKYRYLSLNGFSPEAYEEQRSIIFGDGSSCSFKAKVEDFFNDDDKSATYITIKDNKDKITRWFVSYWKYLNGAQVEVYLRRDIIGEFGIDNLFAQIDRGYVNNSNKLKFKQELELNNKLINRIKLIPTTQTYGSVETDNHENELWGILYFINSTSENSYKINIPAFAPEAQEDVFNIDAGDYVKDYEYNSCDSFTFYICLHLKYTKGINENFFFRTKFTIYPFNFENNTYSTSEILQNTYNSYQYAAFKINLDIDNRNSDGVSSQDADTVIAWIFNVFNSTNKTGGQLLNDVGGFNNTFEDYTANSLVDTIDSGTYTLNGTDFYDYKVSTSTKTDSAYSSSKADTTYFKNFWNTLIAYGINSIFGSNESRCELRNETSGYNSSYYLYSSSQPKYNVYKVTKTEIEASDAGTIEINAKEQLTFEPFQILVCPLYTCNLKYGSTTYKITKQQAFSVFNSVISGLSGENGYILDAQLYPYCPVLGNLATALNIDNNSYPFFNVASSNYEYEIKATLPVQDDVKREYDMHNYRMVSPDQTGTYDFKYYDYKDVSDDEEKSLTVRIKTCLKPYTMVTTALIIPDDNNLKGITYESDLRGSNATGKGFEATMTSNAFETYARQNSNYQEMYELSKEELTLSQNVERNSEITSAVTNTLAAASYGATAGSSLMSSIPIIGSSVGAGIGAGIGAGASIAAYSAEIVQNDKMREFEQKQLQLEYEYNLQQIKNLPDSLNQISSFNEILLQDFWYVIEIYACTIEEAMVDITYYNKLSYDLGICGNLKDYVDNGKFIKATVIQCNLPIQYANVLNEDLNQGVYIITDNEEVEEWQDEQNMAEL